MRTTFAGIALALFAATTPAQAYVSSGACAVAMSTQTATENQVFDFIPQAIDDIHSDVNAWLAANDPSAKAVSLQEVVSRWAYLIDIDSLSLHMSSLLVAETSWTQVDGKNLDMLTGERKVLGANAPLAASDSILPWHLWIDAGTTEGIVANVMMPDWRNVVTMAGIDNNDLFPESWQKVDLGGDHALLTPSVVYLDTLDSAIEERRAMLSRLILQRDDARKATATICES